MGGFINFVINLMLKFGLHLLKIVCNTVYPGNEPCVHTSG